MLCFEDGQASDYENVLKDYVRLALDPAVDPDAEDTADEAVICKDVRDTWYHTATNCF